MDKESLIYPEPSDYLKNLQGLWTVVPLNSGIIIQSRIHSLGPDGSGKTVEAWNNPVCNRNSSFPVLFFPECQRRRWSHGHGVKHGWSVLEVKT